MRFIDLACKTIGRALVRCRLKIIIAYRLVLRRKLKIVIGAEGLYEQGWIPTDICALDLLNLNDWRFYFSRDAIDAVLAEHVWEHLPEKEGVGAAKNCYKFLKTGGYIRVAVPDGFHPNAEYIDSIKPGGLGAGAKDHKILYNFRLLGDVFELAGFKVDLLEYFDEKMEFHCKDWSPEDGMIHRSKRFDDRNQNGLLNYTSIILDAKKI